MIIAGKALGEYFGYIKIPVLIMAGVGLLTIVLRVASVFISPDVIPPLSIPLIGDMLIYDIIGGIAGIGGGIIGALIAVWCGWKIAKAGGNTANALVAGALYGAVTSMVNILFTIIWIILGFVGIGLATAAAQSPESAVVIAVIGGLAQVGGGLHEASVDFIFILINIILGLILALVGGLLGGSTSNKPAVRTA